MFLSLLFSCNEDSKRDISKEVTFDYKAYLLRNNDDVPTFEFSPNSSLREIYDIIKDYTK